VMWFDDDVGTGPAFVGKGLPPYGRIIFWKPILLDSGIETERPTRLKGVL